MNIYDFKMNIQGEGKISVKSKCSACGKSLVFRAGGKKIVKLFDKEKE